MKYSCSLKFKIEFYSRIIHHFQLLDAENGIARTKKSGCPYIRDRETCLTSVESRDLVLFGAQLQNSNCVWCPNGPCTPNDDVQCEPKIFVEKALENGLVVENFEPFLKGNFMAVQSSS